ncbi:MAG: hypothetical protein E6J62_12565 [Deltaproteobacteria bacterium]|nr:MAG: hypothetical protein E6J85_07240 [Deltaproteobacteria bacterium]TMB25788.1 MAG: hypothetical protein E6J61_23325 [Deltaproteobacteria bacterium]TMB32264.1 MAG: hypothetical protein E6J62_12565 [Deltaproteobacteria bacterium]
MNSTSSRGEVVGAERAPAIDPSLPSGGAQRNAIPGYEFPDVLVMPHYVREAPVHGSSLRSLGAGECTMGPTAAAIANALHDALGVRVRELPLTAENITKAINA